MEQQNEKDISEIVSTEKTERMISLKEANIKSYAGLTNLVITFPKDAGIVALTGDQGTGKTSTLSAFIELLGGESAANAENMETKKKSGNLKFEKDGSLYTTSITNSTFELKVTRPDGTSGKLDKPKETLRKLIGSVVYSPMELQKMKPEAQIKWIRSIVGFDEEAKKFEADVKQKKLVAEKERADIGNKMKTLVAELKMLQYFEWNDVDKVLITTEKFDIDYEKVKNKDLNADTVNSAYKKAKEDLDAYNKAVNGLDSLRQQKTDQEKEIERIKEQLALAENKLVAINDRICSGEKYLTDNKEVQGIFQTAEQERINLSSLIQINSNIKISDIKYNEYIKKEQEYLLKDELVKNYNKLLQDFVKKFAPEIEGFEMVTDDNIDAAKEMGLYYFGKPIVNCSESDVWDLWLDLVSALKSAVVMVENMPSLGSLVVEKLNKLANEKGCTVFFSAMNRDEKSIKIEFIEKIK